MCGPGEEGSAEERDRVRRKSYVRWRCLCVEGKAMGVRVREGGEEKRKGVGGMLEVGVEGGKGMRASG